MPEPREELLIVSVTPQNLERGIFWFSENLNSIKKARQTNLWWKNNALILEKDLIIKPAELSWKLLELGYERTSKIIGPGLFALRGGVAEIWPVNKEKSQLVEFAGNVIADIRELPEREKISSIVPPKLNNLNNIQPGCFLVHIDHGIGIFRGYAAKDKFSIYNLQFTSDPQTLHQKTDDIFLIIEYASPAPGKTPDHLYAPLEQKGRLAPYIGFETPKVHRLGGAFWQNTKRRVKEEAEKMAKELLELYAKRATVSRPLHPGDFTLESELKNTFSFTETAGQNKVEKDIFADLSKPYPMDRVLCGDVGFGKTEIAIRAALRVISSGKQVAVLAPTTILAAQHEKTFQERLSSQLPVSVSMLSRLTLPKDEKKILKDLTDGKIDCVIGTHKLFSKNLKFKNLGLLIIDEEQRFGVKQKEHFKNLRAEIDILSLSATPIPRTLSLALAKLRDISLIDTPPPERLAIKTLVLPYSLKTIRRALEFEIKRGGQIYFLHNRIETINLIQKLLTKIPILNQLDGRSNGLVYKKKYPRVGIIHGRMREEKIIAVMKTFCRQELDILLATAIIENGLDISSANTLIVDDATRLGLAQAHQLRGRIGRGKEQAFAYFLYRPHHLTEKAGERLEALKEYAELGDGYQIALRDLEIRGAGNVLGREQSGAINKVGLNLYCQILSEAVEELK